MSGQVKQEGPSCWVWNKGAQEVETECVEVDVEFEDLGEEGETRSIPEICRDAIDGLLATKPDERPHGILAAIQMQEPKHTIPPDIFPAPQSEGEGDSIKFKELYGELCREREALAKCHELIQEQASKLGEEMLARVDAEDGLVTLRVDLRDERKLIESLGKQLEDMTRSQQHYEGIATTRREFLRAARSDNASLRVSMESIGDECDDLKQQLKTMAEDRDEYQAKYQAAERRLEEVLEYQQIGLIAKPAADATNPEHYKQGGIECIDAIEAALGDERFRGYCQGNAIKYLWRHEHKGKAAEDLAKAVWYTERLKGEV